MKEHGGYNPTEMPPRETQHAGVQGAPPVVKKRVTIPRIGDHGGYNPTEMPRRETEHRGVVDSRKSARRRAA